jgi:hypothetical protein
MRPRVRADRHSALGGLADLLPRHQLAVLDVGARKGNVAGPRQIRQQGLRLASGRPLHPLEQRSGDLFPARAELELQPVDPDRGPPRLPNEVRDEVPPAEPALVDEIGGDEEHGRDPVLLQHR